MSLRPELLPPIPDVTAAAVWAAFPKASLYVDLRTECGTPYHAQPLADLYPPDTVKPQAYHEALQCRGDLTNRVKPCEAKGEPGDAISRQTVTVRVVRPRE